MNLVWREKWSDVRIYIDSREVVNGLTGQVPEKSIRSVAKGSGGEACGWTQGSRNMVTCITAYQGVSTAEEALENKAVYGRTSRNSEREPTGVFPHCKVGPRWCDVRSHGNKSETVSSWIVILAEMAQVRKASPCPKYVSIPIVTNCHLLHGERSKRKWEQLITKRHGFLYQALVPRWGLSIGYLADGLHI